MWPEVARTLAARHDSSPCVDRGQNVIVAGFNGWRSESGTIEYEEDRAPCMGATMPSNVVCFDARGHGDSKTINTITRNNGDRITDYTPIVAAFKTGQSADAHGLGYEEEKSPTLAGEAGGNSVPAVLAIDCRNHIANFEISATLQAKDDGGYSLNYINPVCVAGVKAKAEICDNLSPTLMRGNDRPYLAGSGYTVRRLTPVECERLQGFPDNWTASGHDGKTISDSRRYAAIGNSVAVPCVEYIMAGIAEAEIERRV
jgi:hypothetical protein